MQFGLVEFDGGVHLVFILGGDISLLINLSG